MSYELLALATLLLLDEREGGRGMDGCCVDALFFFLYRPICISDIEQVK